MTTLKVSGINAGSIIAATDGLASQRRDIGDEAAAADGTLRITRHTRKRDLAFKTIPLTAEDADAWEGLITGQGEVWSFDASLYGSKGLGPSANVGCTQAGTLPRFGAAKLIVPATTGSISYLAAVNPQGSTSPWTVSLWRSTDGGATWSHYVVRSDGAKWVSGVRNDAASTTWLTVSSGTVTLANSTGTAVWYDDLAVFTFTMPASWPAQLAAMAVAFSSLPLVDLTGDLVTEQASRRAYGVVQTTAVRVASGTRHRLDVELKAR